MFQLTIDGVPLILESALEINQSYQLIGGGVKRRAASGRLIAQRHWSRLKTSISGSGWVPSIFSMIDQDQDYELGCIAPRVIDSPTRVISVPRFRPDASLLGYAVVGGLLVPVPITLSASIATLPVTPGATLYRVQYFPLLTVKFSDSQESLESAAANYAWQITAEEV